MLHIISEKPPDDIDIFNRDYDGYTIYCPEILAHWVIELVYEKNWKLSDLLILLQSKFIDSTYILTLEGAKIINEINNNCNVLLYDFDTKILYKSDLISNNLHSLNINDIMLDYKLQEFFNPITRSIYINLEKPDQKITKGQIVTNNTCHVFSSNKNYCSLSVPESSSSDGEELYELNINFVKKMNGSPKEQTMKFWVHPMCPSDFIRKMVQVMSDDNYFKNITQSEYDAITPDELRLYSKEALLAYTLAKFKDNEPSNNMSFSRDLIEKAVIMEEEMRLSEKVQNEFARIEASFEDKDWMDYALEIQIKVAKKLVGDVYSDEFAHAVRLTNTDHIPHWKRFNRASRGYFQVPNLSNNCLLWDPNINNYVWLHQVLKDKKSVIIASSSS